MWLNEKFSPELLESQSQLTECMMEQIAEMEENIARARKADFKVHIHRMEVRNKVWVNHDNTFIEPLIFFSDPSTFSSVVDRGSAGFAESGKRAPSCVGLQTPDLQGPWN